MIGEIFRPFGAQNDRQDFNVRSYALEADMAGNKGWGEARTPYSQKFSRWIA